MLSKILVLSDVQKALLASVEAHGKSDLKGVYHLYPHLKKDIIDETLAQLQDMGWVKVRKTQVIDGERKSIPCVMRTAKKLYKQQVLFHN